MRTSYAARWAAFVFLVMLGAAGALLAARTSPPTNPSTATTETLGAIAETDGWCVATNGTTSVDLDAAVPARLTTAEQAKVRFVTIKFIAGATSTRACHAIGQTLPATSCDSLDADAVGVLTDGQSATYAVARNLGDGGLPTLDAQANAGTDGAFCVSVGF
jgi:hypothetical protein